MTISINYITKKRLAVVIFALFLVSIFGFFAFKTQTEAIFSYVSEKVLFRSSTANLEIEVKKEIEGADNAWVAGGTQSFRASVKNTGSIPTFLEVYIAGDWENKLLDNKKVSIEAVDIIVDGNQYPIANLPQNMGESFKIHQSDSIDSALILSPSERIEMDIKLKLDASADFNYEKSLFTTSVQIEGKQIL